MNQDKTISSVTAEAAMLHADSIIIDTHCDTLGRVLEGQRRLGERSTLGQFDLVRAREGGLTAQVMATFVSEQRQGGGLSQSLDFMDVFHAELEAFSGLARLATSGDDVRQAKENGETALFLGMEGAEGLGGNVRALRMFHRLGLRVLGMTWNRRNAAADGLDEMPHAGGLSIFGREVVRECNRLGILLDLSHLSPRGVSDVLGMTQQPVVATHANAAAVYPHIRNLSDEQLEGIAATGGVIGIVPVPPFMGDYPEQAPLGPLFDHLDHIISVVGEDHVGLGLDFDGVGEMRTAGIETVVQLPGLTSGMLERGYPAARIRKVLGENFLRVFDQVYRG